MSGQEGTEEVWCTMEGEDLRGGEPFWLKERGWHLSCGGRRGKGVFGGECVQGGPVCPPQRPLLAEPGMKPPSSPQCVAEYPQHHRTGQRKMGL